MGGPGLEGSLRLWFLPCQGPGFQTLPSTLTPFTAPLYHFREASLMSQTHSLLSHLLQGGLLDALTSPTPTQPRNNTHTPLGASSTPFPVTNLDSLPPSFLHVRISSTTSRLPGMGVWNTPVPMIHLQALLWP